MPPKPKRRTVLCAWCNCSEPAYPVKHRCPRCHERYTTQMNCMYFINALRGALYLAPISVPNRAARAPTS